MTGLASGGASGGVTGSAITEEPSGPRDGDVPNLADIRPVGRDGLAIIYRATDLRLQRPVTLKVFAPMLDQPERARFDDDTKKLGRLSAHPNVATVYDAGFTDDGRPYLVWESVTPDQADPASANGPSLGDRLATNGPMPWQQAVDIVLQVCSGLEQAHRAGVLHRELSPTAVIMAGSTPKLISFKTSADRQLSSADQPSGPTPDALLHRAPETLGQPESAVLDERIDLYSLGSILHEMVDGQAPFWRPGDNSAQALHLRLTHEKPPTLEPELVPPALAVFIAAALSKDPLDRPQTADEFAHELRLIREGRITGSTPSVLHGTTGSLPVVVPELSTATTIEPDPLSSVLNPPPPAPVHSGQAIVDPAWPPPVEGPLSDGQTAVYSQFAGPGDRSPANPSQRAPSADDPHPELLDLDRAQQEKPPRSTAFMAAVSMIAVGVIGLAIVVAIFALRPDDGTSSAPVLPDPNEPASVIGVDAEADGSASVTGANGSDAMEDGAMEDGAVSPTTAASNETNTTETTVGRVTVPNLIGLPVEAATKQLTDAGFEVVVFSRISTTAAPGTVTQQKPDAGARVALPLTVTLYIPKVTNLPQMVGRSADSVCLELQALSLTCRQQLRFSDTVSSGSIIASDPAGGALFSDGSTVQLTVSRGPVTTVRVPSVTGLDRTQAEESLQAAGFITISFQDETSENVDPGLAIGSNPGATSQLATDQPVVVLMSTGPPAKARLPNLVGLDQSAAEAQLAALGFTVAVQMVDLPEGDPNIGKVTAMDPAADSNVAIGSAISVSVGQLMAIETTTTQPADTTTTTSDSSTTTVSTESTTTESTTTETTSG